MMVPRSLSLVVLLAWAAMPLPALEPASAQRPALTENEARAKFLSRLGNWATWPERTSKAASPAKPPPFIIGILGDLPFLKELKSQTANLKVKERAIQVVVLSGLRPDPLRACDILYICDSEQDRLKDVLAICLDHPVLTVAGSEDAASTGVMVSFFLKGDRFRLQVNAQAALAAGIQLDRDFLQTMRAQMVGGSMGRPQ